MATLGGTVLTWADMVARLDPDGMPARIANVLEESKPILSDIPWKASNQPLGHRSSVLAGLPTVGFKRLNVGGTSSKSSVVQTEEGLSMIEGWSTTDLKLLELYGNEAATRMEEGRFFVESMGQLAVDTIFYGNVLDSMDEFNGFQPRYNTLATTNPVYVNVLDAGGLGSDLSSVWLIGWGDGKVFGLYPKNCYAGLRHEDWGKQLIQTDSDLGGRKMAAYVDQWNWDLGICVKDWRYVVRIANIEPDELLGVTGDQELNDYTTNLLFLMKRALRHIPNLSACQPRWYMPRAIAEGLDVQFLARTTENVWMTKDVEGKMVDTFFNIPIRIEDALTNSESVVTT